MSNWKEIHRALSNAGIRTYLPAQKVGVCSEPYCVVQGLGTYEKQGRQRGHSIYKIHVFVPVGEYMKLDGFLCDISSALRPLCAGGKLRAIGGESTRLVDDLYKAHTTSLQFEILHGIESY